MADDPNRYAEVPGGNLFLKPGQVPDQPYTETIAKNRAAKDRELLDSMQAMEAATLGAVANLGGLTVGTVPPGVSYNDLPTPSLRFIGGVRPDAPDGVVIGWVWTLPLSATNAAAAQELTTHDGRTFTRSRDWQTMAWSAWKLKGGGSSGPTGLTIEALPPGVSADDAPAPSFRTIPGTRPNLPAGQTLGYLETIALTSAIKLQRFMSWQGRTWTRAFTTAGVWTAWDERGGSSGPAGLTIEALPSGTSADDAPAPSLRTIPGTRPNLPTGQTLGYLETVALTSTIKLQRFMSWQGRMWSRAYTNAGVWTAWEERGATQTAAPVAAPRPSSGSKVVPLAVTAPGTPLTVALPTGTARWVRSWAHAPRRVRVHVSNSNAGNSTSGAGATLTGLTVAVGQANGSVTGVVASRVTGAIPGAGQSLASEWLDTSAIPDGGHLAVTVSWSGATTLQGAQGGGWTTTGTDPAAPTVAGWTRSQTTPLHVWIEAEVPARAPVILAHGDSITIGTAAADPVGDSWAAQYARQVGALPVILAQHGSTMANWGTGSARWRMFDGMDLASVVDVVVSTLGQNDLGASGMDLPTLQSRHTAMMTALREVVPTAPAFLGEITPSNKSATLEALRRDFNAWRATLPQSERGVVRWASTVGGGTDEDLAAQYSADGLHPNAAGHTVMAGVARTARVVPLTLTDAQVAAMTGAAA